MTANKKRKGRKRTRRAKSHGLWIAPDLERTIKGEGGRRGLNEPPYGYYLQLADLALKSWGLSGSAIETARDPDFPFPSETDPAPYDQPPRASEPKPPKTAARLKRSPLFRVAAPAKPPKVDLPKTRQAPKPPKLAALKPPQRQPTPKLMLPKPPKRRK